MFMKSFLILGDLIAILIITLIGFAIHRELDVSFIGRMAVTYFPLSISWFLLAPWFGLFQQETISNLKQLWRPALAMLFAAPFAVVLRGFILNAPILPIFAVILAVTSALGMVVWRGLYAFMNRRL